MRILILQKRGSKFDYTFLKCFVIRLPPLSITYVINIERYNTNVQRTLTTCRYALPDQLADRNISGQIMITGQVMIIHGTEIVLISITLPEDSIPLANIEVYDALQVK